MSLDKYRKVYQQKRNYSIGVEEEFMICDPKNGALTDKANEIMAAVSDKKRYSYELLLSEFDYVSTCVRYGSEAIVCNANKCLSIKILENDRGKHKNTYGTLCFFWGA